MKRLLPALLLLLLAFAACKKDRTPAPNSSSTTGTGTTATGTTGQVSPTLNRSITDSIVTAGSWVSLFGTNLPTSATGVSVLFNGVAGTIQSISTSRITAIVPVTTSGNITVTIDNQTLTGPSFTYVLQPTITGLSTSTISAGMTVTITGTNFITTGTVVTFNGVAATVQSITATEIKAVVPVTTSGKVVIRTTYSQLFATSPAYTYVTSPNLIAPYISGDIFLETQADVDAFVAANKGRQLQITGNLYVGGSDITSVSGLSNITSISGKLTISGGPGLADAPFLNTITNIGDIDIVFSDFTSLSFNNLNSFTGTIDFQGLSKLSRVSFGGLTAPKSVLITYCPLLTDLSFLSNIKSADIISIDNIGATAITMDNLTKTGGVGLSYCQSLSTVSLKSLTNITGNSGLTLSNCSSLSNVNFNALTSISGKLTLSTTNLTDLSGFNSLKTAGALAINNNSALVNFHGLDQLTALTSPAVPGAAASANIVPILNGISINNNAKLTSLTGLQNVTTVPVIYISGNASLNDFCPFKAPITAVSTLPTYSYKYSPGPDAAGGYYLTSSISALTLTNNGNYATTPDVLAAVALCK